MRAAPPMLDQVQLTPERIVREVKRLPSAPKVLPRLKRLLQNGNSSMREIVQLIRLAPAIAARVLQVSNSAHYSKGLRCHTVDEAVNRVGCELVYELVSYAVASQVLVRPLEVYSLEADGIWRQSVACALAAERIALISGDDCSVAYTVGLLHRIGMVVINEWALREEPELRLTGQDFPGEFIQSEQAALGCTQADVGATLLRDWDFSPDMTEPVQWQYAPRSAALSVRMASLLYAARWVRAVVCNESKWAAPPSADLLALLRVPQTRLAVVVGDVQAHLRTISTLLTESNRSADRAVSAA